MASGCGAMAPVVPHVKQTYTNSHFPAELKESQCHVECLPFTKTGAPNGTVLPHERPPVLRKCLRAKKSAAGPEGLHRTRPKPQRPREYLPFASMPMEPAKVSSFIAGIGTLPAPEFERRFLEIQRWHMKCGCSLACSKRLDEHGDTSGRY